MAVMLLTGVIAVLGLCDDLWSWRPSARLAAECGIAIAAVWFGVIYPLRGAHWINILFTVVWIVGITNAFNLLDNMDGLAAGIGIVAGVTLSLLTNSPRLEAMTLIFAAVLGGFLIFNFKPAKIFMGDTGSLAIGFYLACASVLATEHISTVSSILFVPVLVLFIPVFDTLLVSVTRRLSGRAISAGARDHTSHRLVLMGISERRAVLVLYGLAALSGTTAVLWKRMWPELGWGALGVFLLAGTLFWLHMARLRLPEEYLSRTNAFTLVLPALLQPVASRVGAVFLDVAVMALSLYLAFLLRFDRFEQAYLPEYLGLCCIALVVKLPPLALFGAYRPRNSMSARSLYGLLKASILGSLVFIAAAVLWNRFDGLSRAVFAIDLLLTTTLLISVRASGWMFEHSLRPGSKPRCVLVDSSHSRLVNAYFDDPSSNYQLDTNILAAPTNPEWTAELASRLNRNHIQAVFCGPECSPAVRSQVRRLAARHALACFEIDFAIREMSTLLSTTVQPKPISAARVFGSHTP